MIQREVGRVAGRKIKELIIEEEGSFCGLNYSKRACLEGLEGNAWKRGLTQAVDDIALRPKQVKVIGGGNEEVGSEGRSSNQCAGEGEKGSVEKEVFAPL